MPRLFIAVPRLWRVAVAAVCVLLVSPPVLAQTPVDHYLTKVKPLLTARCYACHGGLKQEAGLRLDTAELARRGSDEGSVIDPQAESRFILQRIRHSNPDLRMPPEGEGAPLSAEEIAAIADWVSLGAIGPNEEKPESDPTKHWAFQTVARPEIPSSNSPHPIDAFLDAKQRSLGVVPLAPADRMQQIRRLYLDLIGLPPTAEETLAFSQSTSPDAYEQLVTKLLDDPRHGERWARHWMDVWRYSDWWGLGAEVRNSQKHMWHYRDWIVESLNRNTSYAEMLRLMLAADELYPEDLDRLRATGYLVRSYFKFNRNTWMDETVEHLGKGILGLTVNCSRCHDHKYDPISQREYYQLRAFFEPYQIRIERLPGIVDTEVDGIPRVFDCNLDVPTYRFVRGNEAQPDNSQVIPVATPKLFGDLKTIISPVTLPAVAHHPGLRPWIADDLVKAIDARQASLKSELTALEQKIEASKSSPTPEPSDPNAPEAWLCDDDFSKLDSTKWSVGSGQWDSDGANVRQTVDGPTRSALTWLSEVPTDFEAELTLRIQGGNGFRSVGIAFDQIDNNEMLMYLSAYAGGPKFQAAYRQGSDYAYPADGLAARSVELNTDYRLTLRVRGELINVDIDGQPAIAWQSPLPRKKGNLQLITFDAVVSLNHFRIRQLPATVEMRRAANASAETKESLIAELAFKQQQVLEVTAERESILARATADRARWIDSTPDTAKLAAEQADRTERQLAFEKAKSEVLRLQLERTKVTSDKLPEIDKQIASAQQSVEQADSQRTTIDGVYESLRGAVKTPESNAESSESQLREFPTSSTGRRTALAQWITDPRNPLTARVAVNHIWNRHFGSPLVPTLFDFGRKGIAPANQPLLDWLAAEFMDSGWDMKHLHRLIVTSDAYRRSSDGANAAAQLAIDPENKSLWKRNPLRMESQVVRDSLLYLSRRLDSKIGGPSVDPVKEEQSLRRSLYFVHSHNDHHRFLTAFDDASVQECYRREQSIVPQQALALTNSRVIHESAIAITDQWHQSHTTGSDREFIVDMFVTLLAYSPSDEEIQSCEAAIQQWHALPNAQGNRARVNLVVSLLNHNDFVTIR